MAAAIGLLLVVSIALVPGWSRAPSRVIIGANKTFAEAAPLLAAFLTAYSSTSAATPMPPAVQTEISARCFCVVARSFAVAPRMRAPVAANGWP